VRGENHLEDQSNKDRSLIYAFVRRHPVTWEPVVAAGAAEEDRQLASDELAAAVGEDGRQSDL
jgi:hypothetical protein